MLALLSEIKQDTDLPTRLAGICVTREVNGTPSQHAAHPVAGRLPRDQAMAAGYQILLPVKLSLAPPQALPGGAPHPASASRNQMSGQFERHGQSVTTREWQAQAPTPSTGFSGPWAQRAG